MKYNLNLNPKISPLYQAIRTIDRQAIPYGAGDASYFEPLLPQILAHFSKLMKVYQIEEELAVSEDL